MKILLLEDNKKLNATIVKRLQLKGFKIDSFIDGKNAYDAITNNYDCFILDINVPNIDGIKILKKIREYYDKIPIIIISASVELDLIKQSYDFGCNDYIKKPFFIDELEIKIDQLCTIQNTQIQYDVNSYFDNEASTIEFDNKKVKLTKKERLLLNLLLSKPNQIITYEQIEYSVWEGSSVSHESIRSLVRRLRKALVYEYIKTIIDEGYKFILNYTK
ncbi:response regulator transcription factor [Arcobacter sp. 15-2]|uniref:response regulator transcription factor n=1 Tax=Arcobacter sp. 15-2 TaxID=3374109 RepID=UPI00399CD277